VIRLTPSGNGKTAAGHRRAPDVSLLIVVVVYCEKKQNYVAFRRVGKSSPEPGPAPCTKQKTFFWKTKTKRSLALSAEGVTMVSPGVSKAHECP